MPKHDLKPIDGILLLDKPLHLTSNAALQRAKRLLNAKKAGHTGSLDPLATGMLPLCFGEATKVSHYLLESDKYYHVTVKLGIRTTTGDAEGEVMATHPVSAELTQEKVAAELHSFLGMIEQVPPMYSALKFQGQPLYKLARQGVEVERKPRTICIHSLQISAFDYDTFSLTVHCTKGTYIRTLVDDLGQALGCGAYVIGLRRTAVAPYETAAMVTLERLEQVLTEQGHEALAALLLPIETALSSLPSVQLSTATAYYIRTGQAVKVPHVPAQGLIRLYTELNQFMGIGEINEEGQVAPKRLLSFNLPRGNLLPLPAAS